MAISPRYWVDINVHHISRGSVETGRQNLVLYSNQMFLRPLKTRGSTAYQKGLKIVQL
jgi:hypothetical protein